MNQTKHILRPLLMAIVMLVGMLVPQGAWAITFFTEEGYDFLYENMTEALEELTRLREMGYHVTTMHFDENIALYEELDLSRLGQDITIDLNGCVLTNTDESWTVDGMSCIVAFPSGCENRITIQNGTIESNELDAIYFHGYERDHHQKLILKNVNVVTHSEGRHCLFDAKSWDWGNWGYDGDPESSPKLQIIDSEFHSNGCSAISFTLQRNDEFVKSILPEGYSFYNDNTDVELKECADRPFVDENGNPATDIRTGVSPNLPKMIINDCEESYGSFKQAMDFEVDFKLMLLDDVKEGLYTTNRDKFVTIDLNGHTLDITRLYTNGGYLNIIDSSEGKTGKLIVERFDVETPAENNAVIEGNVITWGNRFTNNGLVEYVDGDFINNGDFITSWTWADDHSSATLRINHADVDAVVTDEDTTPATCIASGLRTYTAAATYRDKNYADTKDEEIAIDPNAHSFTSQTLTADPVENGLYAYACDNGCGQGDEHRFIKDFNGAGNHLELTTDGSGNYTADEVYIEDGKPFYSPVEFTTTDVDMGCQFTQSIGDAVVPATIMLPFRMYAGEVSTLNPQGVRVGTKFYSFTSLDYNSYNDRWEANMDIVIDDLEAYTPYMVVLTDGEEIPFGNAPVTFPATPAENHNTTQGDWSFVATNEAKVWTAEDFGNGQAYYGFAAGDEITPEGKFVKVGVDASIAPLRAYLMKNVPAGGASNAPAHAMAADQMPSTIGVRFNDEEATGIGTLNTETGEFTFDGWYDLQGRRISEPVKGGISIRNGKKVMHSY